MAEARGRPVEPLLVVRDLVKRFPLHGSQHFVQACDGVSLEVYPGETVGVVGESGSGKTTLGRCLLRLVEPTSGEIVFDGHDVIHLSRSQLRELRQHLQIVFQEPFDSLNPLRAIGDQIADPLRIHTSMTRDERKVRVRELLDLVGLPSTVASAVPRGLSPGTLQRCSIARAIALHPKLIVLDEPTSAIPPEAEADIIRLLGELQERLGLAYIFISHDLSLVRAFCDRVVVMYLSQVVEVGKQDALFDDPRHPYSRALLASVLEPDPTRIGQLRSRTERLEGEIPSPIDLPKGCYLASRCRYALDRCRAEPQELLPFGDNRLVRCWRVREDELTPNQMTLERERALESILRNGG